MRTDYPARAMSRLAWALLALTVLIYAATPFLNGSDIGDEVGPFVGYTVFILAFATVGAVVASRRPGNPIGWILLGAGLAFAVGGITVSYAEDAFADPGGPGFGATAAAWVSKWVWMAGIAPVVTFGLLLFPDGRVPSRRWRTLAWLSGTALALVVAGLALAPGRMEDLPVDNPLGLEGAGGLVDALTTLGGAALVVGIAGSIASLVARYRAASSRERQQLKWLTYAGMLLGIGNVVAIGIEIAVGPSAVELTNTVVALSVATVPVAIGIAMLRHRLYDIDVVINRTLVYGALTATLAASYLVSVLVLQLALDPLTEQSNAAIAASTLAVAALFRPARTRIQAAVDRRFYRRRYDAARTLAGFSAHLRDEVDLDALSRELRGVVRETMQPDHVSLWLRR